MRNELFRLAKRPFHFRWVFRFVSGPKRNDGAAFDRWRRRECAGDLKLCPQKLRKGALKPLKQLVPINLCARPGKYRLPPRKGGTCDLVCVDFIELDYQGLSGRELRYLLTTSCI
jgi:hypothetical protein